MNWQKVWQVAKSDYLKLVPILVLAFYVVLIPHLNDPYPVHIDEWRHIAESNTLMREGDISYHDPFTGKALGLRGFMEAGFHLFWGVFHEISGVSWLTICKYFPGIIFMMTILSVFIMARREGFGWEAAFFACLIPTTVGVLGPAFFAPLAIGLLLAPLFLFLVLNSKTIRSYLVLFIFTLFLMVIHAPSAICCVMILIPCVLLNVRGSFKHSLAIGLALAIPFLLTLPLTSSLITSTAKSLFAAKPPLLYHSLPTVVEVYGYLPVLSCLLGTVLLAVKGGVRNYSLVLGLLVLLFMLMTFYALHYGDGMIYLRGLLFMMLMMSVVAGAGLMWLRRLNLPEKIRVRLRIPPIAQNVGAFLCLAFIGVILAISIPEHQNTPYYHMIDQEDYEAFVWIKDNVGEDYEKAILDPWKATAFTAITEKYVYSRTHMRTSATDREVYVFLRGGCTDTAFLRTNGISIVYGREPCSNPDLVEVRKNVYLLEEVGGQ